METAVPTGTAMQSQHAELGFPRQSMARAPSWPIAPEFELKKIKKKRRCCCLPWEVQGKLLCPFCLTCQCSAGGDVRSCILTYKMDQWYSGFS